MWPKSITFYRISSDLPSATTLAESLQHVSFHPCGALEMRTVGFVSPVEHGDMIHAVGGHQLLAVRTEERILPGAVINKALAEKIAAIEEQQGFKVGHKQKKELKERVIDELIPLSHTKQAQTYAHIDPENRILVVATGSQAKAEEVIHLLGKAVDGLTLCSIKVEHKPASLMTQWLQQGDSPAGFTIDRDCDLTNPEGGKARFRNKNLDVAEIKSLIAEGMSVEKLAMTWNDRISFSLSDGLHVCRMHFLDMLKEQAESAAETASEMFDADFMIMAGELQRMLPDLLDAFGGEVKPA